METISNYDKYIATETCSTNYKEWNSKITSETGYFTREIKKNNYIIRYDDDACSTTTSLTSLYKFTDTYTSSVNDIYWSTPAPIDPMTQLRTIIRDRQAPTIVTRSSHPIDIREFRARETLHRMVGDRVFQTFLTRGFVSVKAKSGRIYQIFPGHKFTVCWENGKAIKTLCVVLTGGFAPTDELIMRYILITTDEQDFWQRANVGEVYKGPQRTIDFRPLPEILAELKAA